MSDPLHNEKHAHLCGWWPPLSNEALKAFDDAAWEPGNFAIRVLTAEIHRLKSEIFRRSMAETSEAPRKEPGVETEETPPYNGEENQEALMGETD